MDINVPALLRRFGLLSGSSVSEMLRRELGIELSPSAVEFAIKCAKRIGASEALADVHMAEVSKQHVQDLASIFDLQIEDEAAEGIAETIRGMTVDPDETLKGFAASGKWRALLAGPSAAVRTNVIDCPHCNNPLIFR